MDIAELNEKIKNESAFVDLLMAEIGKVIVGQKEMVERLVVGMLGNGHVLLEGVPGLAKTLAIKTLASAMKAKFQLKKCSQFYPYHLIRNFQKTETSSKFVSYILLLIWRRGIYTPRIQLYHKCNLK